jgi:sulfite reductase (ferredoxin)
MKAIAELFRDSDGLRQNREKARLKFLFLNHGWTAARFQAEIERRLGFSLDPGVPEDPPEGVYRDHVGLHRQRQAGLFSAGLPIVRGRMTAADMRAAAAIAARHGRGELRVTVMQNLLLPNVAAAALPRLRAELEDAGLPLHASVFARGTVACTGTEFCKLALTETKGFARRLVEDLETRLPGFDQHVKLHVTGCPNSCGQHWIADIGLEGKKLKVDGRLVDAYYFCVGGAVGKHAATARPIGYRVAASEVPVSIERLLRAFLAERRPGEIFREFCASRTDDELRALLAEDAAVAVAVRDAPPGRAPHGVDG